MWRQVALPVVLVALSWLTISGATTLYLLWLESSYQRVLDQNVTSMHAASLAQQEVWRLHAEFLTRRHQDTDWRARLAEFDSDLKVPLMMLVDRAATATERPVAAEIIQLIGKYRAELESLLFVATPPTDLDAALAHERLLEVVTMISTETDRLRQINDELVAATNSRRTRISQLVLWTRGLLITLVPALGIALGWWTANRLQQSVARIQVTLHDPALTRPDDLVTVHVRGGDQLATIEQQVEHVVDRLRRTSEDLQAARREVLRAERLAAIGGLAAGVAHELRNPMTSIKLLLQHAASKTGETVLPVQRTELILDEIERMETTIQGLIDFSVPVRPQRKLHDLRITLERALKLVEGRAEKQGVKTNLKMSSAPAVVDGDPQQLHQVFVNLLINGIEAMPDGGELEVTVLPADQLRRITVSVQDSGDGIPSELWPRLFEPFATAKERGTGLGLAVSRRIIEEHDGTIAAQVRHPRGTIFEVTFPTVIAAP